MKPTLHTLAMLAALLMPLSVLADDKEVKVEKKTVKVEKKDDKKVEVKEEKKVVKAEKRDDGSFGSKFKKFWIHDVGGTIGNGLKKGADKISNAFD